MLVCRHLLKGAAYRATHPPCAFQRVHPYSTALFSSLTSFPSRRVFRTRGPTEGPSRDALSRAGAVSALVGGEPPGPSYGLYAQTPAGLDVLTCIYVLFFNRFGSV